MYLILYLFYVVLFKQKTAYEMRISDWSSDVCSSDLGVKAKKVMVAGELDGNVESASRVELLESGALSGDIKAGTLTVAAGSRIRGHVECGWGDKEAPKSNGKADKAERELVS